MRRLYLTGAIALFAGVVALGVQWIRGQQPTPFSGPSTFVAITFDRTSGGARIAVVSTVTGDLVRYLTEAQPGGGPSQLALSPDRRSVFFERGDGTCAGHLASVPLTGGPETARAGSGRLGPEGSPAIRPDGSLIAFTRYDCATGQAAVVITGTGNGSREHTVPTGRSAAGVAWSPDGRLLLLQATGTLLEVDPEGAVLASRELPSQLGGCNLAPSTFAPGTGLILAAQYCGPRGPDLQIRLVELEPASATLRRELLTLPKGMELNSFSLDASGRFLLYTISASVPPAIVISSRQPIQLYRFADGRSHLISADSPYWQPIW